jgi:hypothetical protein
MSALGQKRPEDEVRVESGGPQAADIRPTWLAGLFGGKANKRKSEPLPAARGVGIAFIAICQRDVPKIPIIPMGSTGAIGGRPSFIVHILS